MQSIKDPTTGANQFSMKLLPTCIASSKRGRDRGHHPAAMEYQKGIIFLTGLLNLHSCTQNHCTIQEGRYCIYTVRKRTRKSSRKPSKTSFSQDLSPKPPFER